MIKKVIYVKGCGNCWLYERKDGTRGIRTGGENYDVTLCLGGDLFGNYRFLKLSNFKKGLNSEIYKFLIS